MRGRINVWVNQVEWINEWEEGSICEWIRGNEKWMKERINVWMNGGMNKWMMRRINMGMNKEKWMGRRINVWMNKGELKVNERKDKFMNESCKMKFVERKNNEILYMIFRKK